MSQPAESEKPERLNKVLAHAGFGSRRQVEELIVAGRVSLDGDVVTTLATKVSPDQKVSVDGEPVKQEKLTYWIVNKPQGYICSNCDPDGRPLALDLVPQVSQRVYTVGRLDEGSEGLLLLTNDGELAHRLMHPRFGVEKTYMVQVAGIPTADDLNKLLTGVWLSDGRVKAKKIRKVKVQKQSAWLRIVLNEGKNREIRRMLARLDHKVMVLRRVGIGPITLGSLESGKSRRLRGDEIQALKELAFRPKGRKLPIKENKNGGSGATRK
ncbi:MAG: pseudouridine synthase [Gemmataceae bacterium]